MDIRAIIRYCTAGEPSVIEVLNSLDIEIFILESNLEAIKKYRNDVDKKSDFVSIKEYRDNSET